MTSPRKSEYATIVHGYALQDPYNWMRNKDSDEVLDFLHKENAFKDEYMSGTVELQEHLYNEMRGRIKETDSTAPEKIDGYWYYSRTEEGKQYRIYCRKHDTLQNPEEILLDVNALAADHPYFVLGDLKVSPNHQFLAYSSDNNGSEHFTIRIKDLRTGILLDDSIVEADTAIEWYNDSCTLLYMMLDHTRRPYKIFRHVIGTEQSKDELILTDEDEAFFLDLDKSRDDEYLFISSTSKTTSQVWFASANDSAAAFTSIKDRKKDHEYHATSHGNTLYILSNDNAVNFRLMTADTSLPGEWKEYLSHREKVRLEWMYIYSNHIIIGERTEGLEHIRVQSIADIQDFHYIPFPESVWEIHPSNNAEIHTSVFRFHYSSPITPGTVYDYDFIKKEISIIKQDEILGGFSSSNYITERHFAIAPDGVKVPLTITRAKSTLIDGTAPCFMVGYGSYGFSLPVSFSSSTVSLLDRGFICVRAHIRGGGDMGEEWYLNGKLQQKKNTFTDFIACAEYLIEHSFTSAQKLAVQGGSAGGLLMGAIANMRPDLFNTIVASVPFVDLMNTMLDDTLPLTVAEYEEWGNPKVQEDFEYMLSYSPYDNITHQEYPNILAIAGYHDQRVSYWEPAKWIAKLRDYSTGNSAILLYTKFTAGHFGASGRFDYLKELALEYAFILHHCKP